MSRGSGGKRDSSCRLRPPSNGSHWRLGKPLYPLSYGVLAGAAKHGKNVHGMTDADFTDENVEKIREHARDV